MNCILVELNLFAVFVAVESWKSRVCRQWFSAFSYILLKSLSSDVKRDSKSTFCKSKPISLKSTLSNVRCQTYHDCSYIV